MFRRCLRVFRYNGEDGDCLLRITGKSVGQGQIALVIQIIRIGLDGELVIFLRLAVIAGLIESNGDAAEGLGVAAVKFEGFREGPGGEIGFFHLQLAVSDAVIGRDIRRIESVDTLINRNGVRRATGFPQHFADLKIGIWAGRLFLGGHGIEPQRRRGILLGPSPVPDAHHRFDGHAIASLRVRGAAANSDGPVFRRIGGSRLFRDGVTSRDHQSGCREENCPKTGSKKVMLRHSFWPLYLRINKNLRYKLRASSLKTVNVKGKLS